MQYTEFGFKKQNVAKSRKFSRKQSHQIIFLNGSDEYYGRHISIYSTDLKFLCFQNLYIWK